MNPEEMKNLIELSRHQEELDATVHEPIEESDDKKKSRREKIWGDRARKEFKKERPKWSDKKTYTRESEDEVDEARIDKEKAAKSYRTMTKRPIPGSKSKSGKWLGREVKKRFRPAKLAKFEPRDEGSLDERSRWKKHLLGKGEVGKHRRGATANWADLLRSPRKQKQPGQLARDIGFRGMSAAQSFRKKGDKGRAKRALSHSRAMTKQSKAKGHKLPESKKDRMWPHGTNRYSDLVKKHPELKHVSAFNKVKDARKFVAARGMGAKKNKYDKAFVRASHSYASGAAADRKQGLKLSARRGIEAARNARKRGRETGFKLPENDDRTVAGHKRGMLHLDRAAHARKQVKGAKGGMKSKWKSVARGEVQQSRKEPRAKLPESFRSITLDDFMGRLGYVGESNRARRAKTKMLKKQAGLSKPGVPLGPDYKPFAVKSGKPNNMRGFGHDALNWAGSFRRRATKLHKKSGGEGNVRMLKKQSRSQRRVSAYYTKSTKKVGSKLPG